MTDTPQTSFVVTCHNLGSYLLETLDSLEAQTVQDFEIVVVNDGSTDGETCRVLANLSRARTELVHIERRGLPGARNAGVRHARGRFLCMVDADDLLEPGYLERSLVALSASPDMAFASHWLRAFGDEQWDWTPTDCTFPALLHANTVNGAALMRREFFEQLGGFDETMTEGCEDWEFWIRAVAAGHRGTIIPEFLFRYRRRADSMSRTMHNVPGAAALYGQLVARHGAVFAEHLTDLLQRRDEGIAFLSRSAWMLSSEWVGALQSEARWRADNGDEANARAHGWVAATRLQQAESRLTDLEQQAAERQRALIATEAEVHRLHAAYNREAALNLGLTGSWSWKLTSPIRAAAAWLRK